MKDERHSFTPLEGHNLSDDEPVRSSDILVEMGRMKTVGGQEDMIEDVALNLARQAQPAP